MVDALPPILPGVDHRPITRLGDPLLPGDRSGKQQAPYAVKPELSPSIDDEKGKILASTLVKGAALKGQSKEQLKEVTESALKNQAEEIDQDRVSRQAQRVVRDYFSSIQNDAASAAGAGAVAPTTAPSK